MLSSRSTLRATLCTLQPRLDGTPRKLRSMRPTCVKSCATLASTDTIFKGLSAAGSRSMLWMNRALLHLEPVENYWTDPSEGVNLLIWCRYCLGFLS